MEWSHLFTLLLFGQLLFKPTPDSLSPGLPGSMNMYAVITNQAILLLSHRHLWTVGLTVIIHYQVFWGKDI